MIKDDRDSQALDCVGALIRDDAGCVFVQRRSPCRLLLPGVWDIVGGHVEGNETAHEALAREIFEETGWKLTKIVGQICDWQWEHEGVVRREVDYLVEVDGDLAFPRIERGKHDAYTWVGINNVNLMMEGRADGDCRLRDIVIKALRWMT